MSIAEILERSKKPPLFERSRANIWDDPHISQQMLQAHIHPEWDAASRKHSFVDASVHWLHESILPEASDILDLGCGPGLYCQRLARLGHQLTGVDMSPTSIAYGKKQAEAAGLNIQYQLSNYLQLDLEAAFNAALLIYCDFGALTDDERHRLAANVFQALRPGGIWVLDVWTPRFRSPDELPKTWGVEQYGFWSGQPHLYLSETFHYPQCDVYLDQTTVFTEDEASTVYRVWERMFTKETLLSFLQPAGFVIKEWFGDVAGAPVTPDGVSLAVVAEKPLTRTVSK